MSLQDGITVQTNVTLFVAAIGSRIKYLLDTPEVIWGALDVRAYLEAAHRRANPISKSL